MKIDGREIPVQVIRTQYGQFVEVYEVKPGCWMDLASNIQWTPRGNGHWTSRSGMAAKTESK